MTRQDNTNSSLSRSIKDSGVSGKPSRKFSLENLGCAKNQVDAEILIAALEKEGWEYTPEPGGADLIIVNSCGFIESAKEESINTCLELRAHYPEKKLLLAGCLAQRYGAVFQGSDGGLAEVDGIFGNKDLSLISGAVEGVIRGERLVLLPPAPGRDVTAGIDRTINLSFPGSVYIKISEGCDNNCTYCAIPLIRGRLTSRPAREITAEISRFARQGIKEFNLVGQDLASFGRDHASFGRDGGTGTGTDGLEGLLEEILSLEGDFWIRLLYIHPDNFPRNILKLFQKSSPGPRLLPYFDIPFQHASAGVLARMGRRGSKEAYLDLIAEIRRMVPDAIIRSTLMTGFPGEGEGDFRELLDFQQKARLDWLGVFAYSREEDTPAYSFAGPLAHRLGRRKAAKRKSLLETLQIPISEERMERFVGRELPVLIEESVEQENLFLGRAYLQAPEVDGLTVVNASGLKPGQIQRVKIIKRNGIDLEALPLI